VNKKYLIYAGFFLAGVVLASKVRALPGLNALPEL
jgi:hypothetical protein